MTSCIKIESDVRVRDKNSNRATVRIISNFNPLRGRFPLLLSSACLRHYALLQAVTSGVLVDEFFKYSAPKQVRPKAALACSIQIHV